MWQNGQKMVKVFRSEPVCHLHICRPFEISMHSFRMVHKKLYEELRTQTTNVGGGNYGTLKLWKHGSRILCPLLSSSKRRGTIRMLPMAFHIANKNICKVALPIMVYSISHAAPLLWCEMTEYILEHLKLNFSCYGNLKPLLAYNVKILSAHKELHLNFS